MKIRVKTHNGELPSYLTVGRVYNVIKKITIDGRLFFNVVTDNGNIASVSSHDLNGGSWEVVSE